MKLNRISKSNFNSAKARLERLEKNKKKVLELNAEQEIYIDQEANPPIENIDREPPKDRKMMSNNPFEVDYDDEAEVDNDALEELDDTESDIKKAPIDEAEYSEDDLTQEIYEADIKVKIQKIRFLMKGTL